MKISVLVGVVPPDPTLKQKIEDTVQVIDDHEVSWWRESVEPVIVAAQNEETGDVEKTMLLQALTDANPDSVIECVNSCLNPLEGGSSCELWVSAPAPLPLRNSAEEPWINDCTDCDHAVKVMKKWGLFAHHNLLNTCEKDVMDILRIAVDAEINKVEALLAEHRPRIAIGQDCFLFKEIASRNTNRFDLLVTHNEVINSFVSSHVVSKPEVRVLLDQLLGPDWTFDVSVVYSRPGASYQGWHTDGDHEKLAQDAGFEVDGWERRLALPYAVCLFFPLIDLDDSVGYTQFWPGSHRSRDFLGFGKVAELTGTWDGKCQAGTGIFYDYRLWHRGMPNSSDVLRPILQVLFRQEWYIEKSNYGTESIASETTKYI